MDESASASNKRGEASGYLPLSIAQEQLWFVDQLSPGEPTYNVPLVYQLVGELDVPALRAALTWVVARHDALRATFGATDGVPHQRITPAPAEVELTVDDLTTDLVGVAAPEREAAAVRLAGAEAAEPFDLTSGPLYRFRLIRVDDRHHVLCLTVHHIVTDGWSTGVINADLTTAYTACLAGGQPPAVATTDDTAGSMTYADHVARQRAELTDARAEEHLGYWERQLAGLPTIDLPTDRSRPATQSFRGDQIDVRIPAELVGPARKLAQRNGVSLFTVLTAALAIVVNRYTAQSDLPLGMTMIGRDDPALERVVGLFANMVVLRTDLSGDPTVEELLERLLDTSLDAFDHANMPFERVVNRVKPVRDPGRNPLFQISAQLLGDANSGANLELPGLTTELVLIPTGRSRFDLTFTFVESTDEVRVSAEYATDLFDRWRVEALAGHLITALAAMVRDPRQPISAVDIVDDTERARLLAWGTAPLAEQFDEPVHARIARTAAALPDHPAVVFEGKTLSYAELDRRADLLARYLRARGVGHQDVVPLLIRRDLDTLVALLGVLKAGAAFATLDPDHPANRLAYIIRDTGAKLVLTRSDLLDRLPQPPTSESASESEPAGWTAVPLDTEWARIEATPVDGPLPAEAGPDSLAYVLYTSGSTGRPKGVQIEHRALNSFVTAYRQIFDLVPEDRMLQYNALTFDMCQGETFTGLVTGATLVLVPPDLVTSPDRIADLMCAERVSYICVPPAMLAMIDSERPYPDLTKVMVGGEAAPGELVNRWNLPGRRMINLYGPTEATVGCTSYQMPHQVWQTSPPIGTPLLDRRLYVVDGAGRLAPTGVPGELLIGGDEGLARGYLSLPELDAQRFQPDPFHSGGRIYRSGDLVRWRDDGVLEFLGRLDSQVKLRGLRIELGEIESVLTAHPQVGMAVVVVAADPNGDKQIVAYAVPEGPVPPTGAELRAYLAEHLPTYMVPATVQLMDEFPTTGSGKVDRAALPAPTFTDQQDAGDIEPPATATEARVAEIFAEVLSLPRVGADANLFDLGGNSLQAMRMVSRLNREFGVTAKVRMLYGTATVRTVATAVDDLLVEAEKAAANAGETGNDH